MVKKSALQIARSSYSPKIPASINGATKLVEGKATESVADQADIKNLFPNTYGMPVVTFEKGESAIKGEPINVGVILSGGQAPGGHNVISGIFDGIKTINADSKLYGFLGGPSGLVDHKYMELTAEIVDEYLSYLACGIVNVINIFQPNVLSIGGGICNEGEYLTKPLLEKVYAETYSREGTPRTEIKIAELGNDAGIIGAAVLGR